MKIGKYEIDNGWIYALFVILIFSVCGVIIYFDDPNNRIAHAEEVYQANTNIHDYVVLLDYPVDSTMPVNCWIVDKSSINVIGEGLDKHRYWMKNGDNLLIAYDDALIIRDTYDNVISKLGLKNAFCKGEQYR